VASAFLDQIGLWVAAQRAMPSWARGRLNATFITISQGAMVLWGVIWGFAASIAGVSYTLLGAALLFLTSLLLAPGFSIVCRPPFVELDVFRNFLQQLSRRPLWRGLGSPRERRRIRLVRTSRDR
jgi:hypothetical protein